jgi:hypothetical protein
MQKSHRVSWQRRLAVAIVPLALLGAGCTATGGGSIPSAGSPAEKATFGLNVDGTTQTFSGSYHDPVGFTTMYGMVDVAFKGTGKVNPCSTEPRCQQGPKTRGTCLFAEPTYESQNRSLPGSGLVFFELCDADGDGDVDVDGTDTILVIVDTGPYAGYTNGGSPRGDITVSDP